MTLRKAKTPEVEQEQIKKELLQEQMLKVPEDEGKGEKNILSNGRESTSGSDSFKKEE